MWYVYTVVFDIPTILSMLDADFTTIRKRYVIEGKLICEGPVAVGAPGEVFQLVDRPVIRIRTVNGQTVPYIPGSSVKGVLRNFAETLLRTFIESTKINIIEFSKSAYEKLIDKVKRELTDRKLMCSDRKSTEEARTMIYVIEKDTFERTEKRVLERAEEYLRKCLWNIFCCNALASNVEQDLREVGSISISNVQVPLLYMPCVACQLFGGGGLASHVVIYDAFPESPEEVFIGHRTCVSIDRVFRRQKPGRLFTIEYVEPGSRFNFRMEIINIDLESATKFLHEYAQSDIDLDKIIKEPDTIINFIKGLKAYIISLILKQLQDDGIQVGGRRSVGLGRVRLSLDRATVYYVEKLKLVKKDASAEIKAALSAITG